MSVDRSAIYSDILARNALRRGARLPALDVTATYHQEVAQAMWQAFAAASYPSVRRGVLAELRARHGQGFGKSAGGRWAVELLTRRALEALFRQSRLT